MDNIETCQVLLQEQKGLNTCTLEMITSHALVPVASTWEMIAYQKDSRFVFKVPSFTCTCALKYANTV